MSDNGAPNPSETRLMKRAGVANLALQVVASTALIDPEKSSASVVALHDKACSIIGELLDQWVPEEADNQNVLRAVTGGVSPDIVK